MSLKDLFSSNQKKEKVQQYILHGIKVNVVPEEKKFVEDLFASLASIPTGRKALEDMKKYHVDFHLETALGTAGGYFSPSENRIVMAKSLGMDFMEFSVVHEARHLLQDNLGGHQLEEKKLDYASRLMFSRAIEADAQTQAIKACKEWEALGHTAPLERFEKHYKPIVDRFNKSNSLSEAFKGWYDDERITAAYENSYDICPALSSLTNLADRAPYVSLTPKDIAKICDADRVEGFEEFLNSTQARQIHRLTKTAVELYDAAATAKGSPKDPSLDSLPLRDLKNNPTARSYADKYITETLKEFSPEKARYSAEKKAFTIVERAVREVKKINDAEISGKKDLEAEKKLQTEKNIMYSSMKGKNLLSLLCNRSKGEFRS